MSATVMLWKPKTAENIGSALRSCACYDASLVVVEPRCPMNKQTRRRIAALATHAKAKRYGILSEDEARDLLWRSPVLVIERTEGAKPLPAMTVWLSSLFVFGPENGSVPSWILDKWPAAQIPAGCLNLAASVATVLYDHGVKMADITP